MLVTLSGILMLVSVSQQLNAKSPMLVTLSGILYVLSFALYVIIIVLSALNKIWFSYINDSDSFTKEPCQYTNGFPVILITLSGMLMLVRELHEENAPFPMLVTPPGILMQAREEHKENAKSPKNVTLSGMLMLVSDSHPVNAESPMLVTLSGMLMLVRESHHKNALSQITFVPSFII